MKSSYFLFFFVFPFGAYAQQIDIYSKWTCFPNSNTQVILDLTSPSHVTAQRMQILSPSKYRIDSFGYKQNCSIEFKDIDSSTIFWGTIMESKHLNNYQVRNYGKFIITQRNRNGVPVQMKLADEMNDLAIGFPVGDTILFTRMVTRGIDEIERRYPTFFGGSVEETLYFGENSGSACGLTQIGMRYKKIQLQPKHKNVFFQNMILSINGIRNSRNIQPLLHDNRLDTLSFRELNYWYTGMNKSHQVQTEEYPLTNVGDLSDSIFVPDNLEFIHYPFNCGRNMLLIASVPHFTHSKKSTIQYLKKSQDRLINNALTSMMCKRGSRQNLLNSGYTTIGFDIQLVKGSMDDFYFDENSRRVVIRRNRFPNYYLMIAQTFSIDE